MIILCLVCVVCVLVDKENEQIELTTIKWEAEPVDESRFFCEPPLEHIAEIVGQVGVDNQNRGWNPIENNRESRATCGLAHTTPPLPLMKNPQDSLAQVRFVRCLLVSPDLKPSICSSLSKMVCRYKKLLKNEDWTLKIHHIEDPK